MYSQLTDRQKEILDFIESSILENGYPPTYREIGYHFGISSTFGVKRHIDALVKKEYLSYEVNTGRTLSLVRTNTKSNDQYADPYTIQIPVVGRVAAGFPIFAEENIEDTLSIDKNMLRKATTCFALMVRGDSMINAGILEGDYVIVAQQSNANTGDIIVALLQEESTLKRFIKEPGNVYLKPENKDYPIIPVSGREDFSIIGKVVGLVRKYN
jgi:repressor LexA